MISSLNFCCLFFFPSALHLSIYLPLFWESWKKEININSAGGKFEALFLSIAVQDKRKSLKLSCFFITLLFTLCSCRLLGLQFL